MRAHTSAAVAPHLNLLIVDDSADDALLIADHLREAGYELNVERADTEDSMTALLRQRGWDAVIADIHMPHFSAMRALELCQEGELDCPFIVVSGKVGEEAAVSLLKAGAHDFLLKGSFSRLVPALERELREAEIRREKRRAEAALRESEARYARACQGTNDGLWDWDLITNTVYYSPRWKAMFGYAETEIGDTPEEWFGRVVPESDASLVRASLDYHLAGDVPQFTAEHRIRHRDGGWRWALVRGQAVRNAQGRAIAIAGSASDITARKLAEQELRRAKREMEGALATKTRFLAAASHDLRQPVQALLCYSSLLTDVLRDHPTSEIVASLDAALGSLKALLDSLLDVSKLDAGLVKPQVQAFPVNAVLSRVIENLRPEAVAKGIDLRFVPSRSVITSDPLLLGRIIGNLCENAIRYTEHGRVLIGCRRRGLTLSMEVWDTGIGIPAGFQEQIFEEFFQVGNPERDRHKGLGLGLAIVQRLARLLRHDLSVRSQPGQGTVFTVNVPLSATCAPITAAQPAQCDLAAKGKVLVVDDEPAIADTLAAVLSSWGFEPIAVGSGSDALAALVCRGCDLTAVIADYRLRAEETGAMVLAQIYDHCHRRIPSVILTGDTSPDRMRDAQFAGAVLLHKPVHPADIRQALATAVSQQPSVPK